MKAIACTVLVGFFTISAFSQDSLNILPSSDVGLRMSLGHDKQISFDYRKYVKEDLKLVLGLDYLNSSTFPGNPQVISASTDSVQFEQSFQNIAKPTFRFGVEKTLKRWPNLYGGVHFTIGYQQSNTQYSIYTDTLSEAGTWERAFDHDEPFDGIQNYKNHFISTGAVVIAGWDVPISEHFIFNLNVSQSFEAVIQTGKAEVTPKGNYTGNTNVFNADSKLGLGLRYQF